VAFTKLRVHTSLKNIFAFPARITDGRIPFSRMMSNPYLNAKAIPSCAALKK